ncbi:MAG: methylenetetrahydrofolate reductase [Betaproteobacteria bacterium]|nr:methylenetetrahydrofolate reductase [Betaproteobacteria bacterium]
MHSQKKFERVFSFEFFPPNTPEGRVKLRDTTRQLAQLNPKFFSVTFGAGGSTRDRTLDTVLEIIATGHSAAPHISCIASTRGYANELVEFIRREFGRHFSIDVAAYPEYHPQARTAQEDLLNFKRKIEAGADSAITQYFYNADAYYHFVDQCEAMGLDVPIVPGIMPIGKFAQLARFSDACGAEIPRWIRRKLEGYGDDTASIRAFGLDVVTALCDELLANGAPGLHFYTLNQAGLTSTIWQRLGL